MSTEQMKKPVTIAEFIAQEGKKIGVDILRIKPTTVFENTETGYTNSLGYPKPHCYVGQGTAVVASPGTDEYFLTLDKKLVYAISEKFHLEQTLDSSIPGGAYNTFKIKDAALQKQWMAHKEYMKPENVEAREHEASAKAEREIQRSYQADSMKRNNITPTAVKDVIRQAGFDPLDYVELKEGMIDLGPAGFDSTPKTIQLPKEEDVSKKYYIAYDGNTYRIGNTDTNEAVITQNQDLVEAFRKKGYEDTQPADWVSQGIERFPYRHNHYGITFKDAKVQEKWEMHKKKARHDGIEKEKAFKKAVLQENKNRVAEAEKYGTEPYLIELDNRSAVEWFRRDFEKAYAAERASKRNIHNTLDEHANEELKKGLRQKPNIQKRLSDLENKKRTQEQAQEASQKPQQKPSRGLIARLFKRDR